MLVLISTVFAVVILVKEMSCCFHVSVRMSALGDLPVSGEVVLPFVSKYVVGAGELVTYVTVSVVVLIGMLCFVNNLYFVVAVCFVPVMSFVA